MRLGHGHCAPSDRSWQGVYIDDQVTVGILRGRNLAMDRLEGEAWVRMAEEAYTAAGLVRRKGKEVRGAESASV